MNDFYGQLFSEHERALLLALMLEAKIIPFYTPNYDLNKTFEQFSPEQTRIMKRKFRKIWRKIAKQRRLIVNKHHNISAYSKRIFVFNQFRSKLSLILDLD
jgi:hypothetical protein